MLPDPARAPKIHITHTHTVYERAHTKRTDTHAVSEGKESELSGTPLQPNHYTLV